MSNHEENGLKSELRQNLNKLEEVRRDIGAKQNIAIKLQAAVDRLKTKLESLTRKKNKNLHMSDHAFVRYFERVLGYDIQELERLILTDQVRLSVATLGGKGEFTAQNYCLVIENNVVVTVTNRKK